MCLVSRLLNGEQGFSVTSKYIKYTLFLPYAFICYRCKPEPTLGPPTAGVTCYPIGVPDNYFPYCCPRHICINSSSSGSAQKQDLILSLEADMDTDTDIDTDDEDDINAS